MPKTNRERLQFHWDHGHFLDTRHPDGRNVSEADLDKLTLDDTVVKQAIASWQSIDLNFSQISQACHSRDVHPDGEIGPVTEAMYEVPRCGCDDFGDDSGIQPWDDVEAAIGRGHWANCHGASGFHRAVGRCVGTLTSHLSASYQGARVIDAVMRLVRQGYGEIGLEWIWDWERRISGYQTEVRFGRWAGRWIGLAQVPSPGRSCSAAPLWAQHQNNFRSGSSPASVLTWWPILIMHELGHNCSSGHSRGGIMNPSILSVPPRWVDDTSERLFRSLFGGSPVPGWPNFDGTDGPPPGEDVVWEWQQWLEFPDGTRKPYQMQMTGPMLPGPGYGTFSGNWGKDGPRVGMQCLFQPRLSDASLGTLLEVAI